MPRWEHMIFINQLLNIIYNDYTFVNSHTTHELRKAPLLLSKALMLTVLLSLFVYAIPVLAYELFNAYFFELSSIDRAIYMNSPLAYLFQGNYTSYNTSFWLVALFTSFIALIVLVHGFYKRHQYYHKQVCFSPFSYITLAGVQVIIEDIRKLYIILKLVYLIFFSKNNRQLVSTTQVMASGEGFTKHTTDMYYLVDQEYSLYNHNYKNFRFEDVFPPLHNMKLVYINYFISTSHKVIGFGYLAIGLILGFVAFSISQLMRFELGYHGLYLTRYARSILEYNALISTHGIVMLFGFVMPIGFAALGNWFLPVELGVNELTMPRLNMLSLWLFVFGIELYAAGALVRVGGLNSGWTFYPPLSTRDADAIGVSTDMMLASIHFLGLSSAIGGINFITTMKEHRHKCLEALGLTLYVWSLGITAVLLVLALPLLALAVTGVILDRTVITVIYDGEVGDPVMFQHLFWFFGHPEVYIVMLPVFGLVSVTLAAVCSNSVIGRDSMVFCMWAIGIIGFVVWGHHMFCVGLDVDSRVYFSIATAVIGIPTAVKVFSYISTMLSGRTLRGSSLVYTTCAFLSSFIIGGLSGLMLSSAGLDVTFHDTYFVVGHFHTVLSLATVFGLLVAFDIAKILMTSSSMLEAVNTIAVLLLLIGASLIFGYMHISGMNGMTRRVPESPDIYHPTMQAGTTGTIMLFIFFVFWLRSRSIELTHNSKSIWLERLERINKALDFATKVGNRLKHKAMDTNKHHFTNNSKTSGTNKRVITFFGGAFNSPKLKSKESTIKSCLVLGICRISVKFIMHWNLFIYALGKKYKEYMSSSGPGDNIYITQVTR